MPSKPSNRKKARHLLVQALYQWHLSGSDINIIEAEFFADNKMDKVDTAYFRELLHAIPRRVDELDATFAGELDRHSDALDPVSLTILRIGTFELMHRLDIPYRVVLNESVNLAKTFGPTEAHKYVNSILDKVAAVCRRPEVGAVRGEG